MHRLFSPSLAIWLRNKRHCVPPRARSSEGIGHASLASSELPSLWFALPPCVRWIFNVSLSGITLTSFGQPVDSIIQFSYDTCLVCITLNLSQSLICEETQHIDILCTYIIWHNLWEFASSYHVTDSWNILREGKRTSRL